MLPDTNILQKECQIGNHKSLGKRVHSQESRWRPKKKIHVLSSMDVTNLELHNLNAGSPHAILSKVTSTTWLLQNALTKKLCSGCALLIFLRDQNFGICPSVLIARGCQECHHCGIAQTCNYKMKAASEPTTYQVPNWAHIATMIWSREKKSYHPLIQTSHSCTLTQSSS